MTKKLTDPASTPFNPSVKYPPRTVSGKGVVTPTPSLVAPSQINKMAGVYRPAPCPPQRPGSDDHTRLPSLRNGRCVPFVPGYIPL